MSIGRVFPSSPPSFSNISSGLPSATSIFTFTLPRIYSFDTVVLSSTFFWIFCIFLYNTFLRGNASEPTLPYPPGPRRLPVVGNWLNMPNRLLWHTMMDWKKQYGDMVFVKIWNRSFLFVNTYESAVELMEKRSAVYSSRDVSVMVNDLEGWDWMLTSVPYGEQFRRHRAAMQKFLMPELVDKYQDMQTKETHRMIVRLMDFERNKKAEGTWAFARHVKQMVATVILLMTYGDERAARDNYYVELSEEGIKAISVASAPGAFLVDAFPWLRHVPDWFPGAKFKRIAREATKLSRAIRYELYNPAKDRVLKGIAEPSITRQMLESAMNEKGEIDTDEEDIISASTGMLYMAGADTVNSVLMTFILALTLHPEYQRMGQAELDRVVGPGNLPTFADRPNLPFVDALYRECLRWQPPNPVGVPHATSGAEWDVVRGKWKVPRGTVVVPTQWVMLRDPDIYERADEFWPERWLREYPPGKCVPSDKIAFGFGRRICPGRFMAENGIFIMIATVLATLNVGRAKDENGNEIIPKVEYYESNFRTSFPFECTFTPRSKQVETLIRQAVDSQNDTPIPATA